MYHASEICGGFLYRELGADAKFMEQSVVIEDYHLEFIKRCIVRMIYYQGSKKSYVGCPLSLMLEPELFRRHFPFAKVIVCVRDPV